MIDPTQILELRVYPPIGIARVGNAPGASDYVIGPEVIGGAAILPGAAGDARERPARFLDEFRTPVGEIKRQAARFRLYAHMKDGSVREVTADDAKLTWRVAVANLKAGWYDFSEAMDLPNAQKVERRNRNLSGTLDRLRLDIVPNPRSIEGPDAGPVAFDDGMFWSTHVYLGEMRTDAKGRLLFLSGRGQSAPFHTGLRPLTFANNEGWHDDVCDGPVRASATFPDGQTLDAVPGYVAVTPPNYAPGLFGVVTLDDAVREVFQAQGWIPRPTASSFTQDIWPIFDRLSGLQWVNHGFFVTHGFGSPLDARDPLVVDRLKDGSAAAGAWRRAVLSLFRDPAASGAMEWTKIPQEYGDNADFMNNANAPANTYLAVSKTQYAHLQRWAAGDFASDWPGSPPSPPDFASLSSKDQVAHLERASLHNCLGGPFHPAMELTWVMRLPRLWQAAYRLKVLSGDKPAKQDFGRELTPAECIAPGGPFDGVAAGALTRFLGVPWQTDHTSCNSSADYAPASFLSMPTFWGARAPDQVLGLGSYLRARELSDLAASPDTPAAGEVRHQILKHVMHREDWLRDVRGFDYYDRLAQMVAEWAELGMVLPARDRLASMPELELRVEQGRAHAGALIDLRRDAKYQLTSAIEALHAPVGAAPPSTGLAAAAAPAVAPPPKRTYRQGEI